MKEIDMYIKLFGIKIFNYKKTIKDTDINIETKPNPSVESKLESAPMQPNIGTGTMRPDLKELEKKVLNIKEKPDPIKVTCKSCEGITYDDDIDFCCKCGKEICSNCGSVDTIVNPMDKEIIKSKYCEKCWSEV